MKKTLLFSMLMLATCVSMSAQHPLSKRMPVSPTANPKATIQAGEGQMWWGPGAGEINLQAYGIRGIAETYELAAYYPGNLYGLEGRTVHAIRVYIPNVTPNAMGDSVVVWIASSRPTTASKANIQAKVISKADLTFNAFNDFAFDQPYTITNKGIYVGYSFRIADASTSNAMYCVPAIDRVNASSGWLRTSTSYPSWYNYSDFSFPIDILFSGDMPEGRASINTIEDTKGAAGKASSVKATLYNESPKGISSVSYTLTQDGNTSEELTHTLAKPFTQMGWATVELPFTVGNETGAFTPTLHITKVNGVENAASETGRQKEFSMLVYSKSGLKRVVEEEFTGTWCGWCPRGMVGMELAEKTYGDRFIGIAVHKGQSGSPDPMETNGNNYTNVMNNYISGFPSCLLDRTSGAIDPYYGTGQSEFSLKYDFDARLAKSCEADIEVSAEWTTDAKKTIKATTNTTFYISSSKSNYAIGFVLLSDSLKGTTTQWAQTNYFSNYAADFINEPNLSQLAKKGSRIVGLAYNHVAILGRGVDKGLTSSVSAPIVDGETQVYSNNMTLPTSTTLVQNKANIRVVALLFDTTTGEIVNAAVTRVSEPTGIADVVAKDAERVVGRYNLQGKPMRVGERGVMLVKYADGHSEKVLFK